MSACPCPHFAHRALKFSRSFDGKSVPGEEFTPLLPFFTTVSHRVHILSMFSNFDNARGRNYNRPSEERREFELLGQLRIVIVMIQQVPKISIARPASGGCGRESNFALQVVPSRDRPTLDLKTWIPQSAALSAHSMHSTQIKLGAELLRDAKLSQIGCGDWLLWQEIIFAPFQQRNTNLRAGKRENEMPRTTEGVEFRSLSRAN